MAKLRLSLLGLLLSRSELVHADLGSLPPIKELPPEWAMSAVHVLRFGGDPASAVDYAYRYLRAHFDDVHAHQAMIASMMPGPPELDVPPRLETVAPNAAVCYAEPGSGEQRWVVLETSNDLSSEFEEISTSSALAAELIGRKVGDSFTLAKGTVKDREATIVQILPKYVRRYQDSMTGMQVRFGVAGGIESVRLESRPGEVTAESIEPILKSLERRAAAVDKVREIYTQNPVPLHMYGTGFGSNAYEALIDLAQAEDQPVKCTLGTEMERNSAGKSLDSAQGVVLDITALATLRLLGLTKVLSSNRFKFILPQSVLVTLHEMSTYARMHLAEGGTFSHERGRPTLYEQTAASKVERNKEEYEILRSIEEGAHLQSGMGLAELDPSRREFLERAFGHYGAESVVIAASPNYVLWSDDLVQSQTAATEFGVQRVWTQLVLENLASAGLLSPQEYAEASARLVGMEFLFTAFDPATMLAGFKLAGWSPEARPAKQFLKVFADPGNDLRQIFAAFVRFCALLYLEPIEGEKRCVVLQALMDALAIRAEAMALLESLRRTASQVFGMNVVGENQFGECFDRWRKQREQSL